MGGATGAGQGQCVMELLPTCGQQVMELPVWPGRLVREVELLRAAVGRVWELCTNTPTGLKLKMETTLAGRPGGPASPPAAPEPTQPWH